MPDRPVKSGGKYTVTSPALMPGGDDKVFREFIQDFQAFAAHISQCRSLFGMHAGLSGSTYSTLVSIAHLNRSGEVGVSRVAEHLSLSGAYVTIEVNKLVKEGLIDKQGSEADRRRVILRVTEKGEKVLARLRPIIAPVNDCLFQGLTPEEFVLMAGLMKRLVPNGAQALTLGEYLVNQNEDHTRPEPAENG
ncbi:MAG: winged helix-turn-helix transcriptional regulator [Nitratireductor sp.]|nr:winged helix-turn-helix transcriptional regulator [Nitratireductor sp.]